MNIEASQIFVNVIHSGSFSKAAIALNLPKSTVSRTISKLENETGTKLIVRTTRSLSLTEAGREYYEDCLPAILRLEEANKKLLNKDKSISGLVKLTAPEDLGHTVVTKALAKLTLKHPDLSFEFSFTDKIVDVVKDGFDIAIRLGKRQDSSLKLKPAGEFNLILVASPKFLAKFKKISHPSDLKDHVCISHSWSKTWKLKSSKSKSEVSLKSKLVGNQMLSMIKLARSGCGVSFVPNYLCENYLKTGELVQLLPEWKSPPVLVSIITTVTPSSVARIKVTVEAISNEISNVLNFN